MSKVNLRADTGRMPGTRISRRLRREGMVPATFYGHGSEAVSISVDARDLQSALATDAGLNVVIHLEVGDETHTSLARQLQRHPTRGDIIHLDFLKISLTDEVEAVVALDLMGDPTGIREGGGILETIMNTIRIRAMVTVIPESIHIDISDLEVGDALRVSDLPAIEGVEYLEDPDRPIVVISLPAIVQTDEEEVEEGDLPESEEGAEESSDTESDG